MAERRAAMFGTEKDQQNCPFYLKIGACRHGDRCSRLHNKPIVSQTIILPNIYQSPYLKRPAGQPPLPASEEEIQKHFDDFYEDIHEGLSKYGKIELLHVCANLGDHLIGNLYVKYATEDAAAAAIEGLRGRFYDGRPIVAEFSPVTDFNESRCRQFDLGTCDRGGFCNFMHLHNPSRELSIKLFGDRRSRSPSPRYRREFRGRNFRDRRDYRERDYYRDYGDRRDYRDDYRDSRDRRDYRDSRDEYYRGGSGGGSGGNGEYRDDRYGGDHRESGYKRSRSRSRSRDRAYSSSYEQRDQNNSTDKTTASSAPPTSSNSSISTTTAPPNENNTSNNNSSSSSTTNSNGSLEPIEKKLKTESSSSTTTTSSSTPSSSTSSNTESFIIPTTESQTIQWASSEERRTDDYDVKTSLNKTSSSPSR